MSPKSEPRTVLRSSRSGLGTRLKARMLCLGAAAALAAAATAGRAATVTGFTFENVTVGSAAGTTPSVTAGGSGSSVNSDLGVVAGTVTALHASNLTVYSTPAGNGSAKSFSSNNWGIGDFYQINTNTSGVTGVQLLFDQTSSGTGPAGFKVSYSTDGGTSFTDLPGGSYTINPAVAFSSGTENPNVPPRFLFSFNGALDDVPNAVIRLVDTTAPGGTAGTSRIDNVIVGTNLVPEPGALGLLGLAAAGFLRRPRRTLA